MSGFYLSRGDVIQKDNKWLILDITGDSCLLIMLETKRMKIVSVSVDELLYYLENNVAELISLEKKENKVIPFVDRSSVKMIHERMRRMADDVLHCENTLFWLADCKKRASFIYKTAELYDVSHYTVRRFLHDYLQNNLSLHGLNCKYYLCGGKGKQKQYTTAKRPGRRGLSQVARTAEVIAQFEVMKKRYLASKSRMSMNALYVDFCKEYYSSKQVVNGSISYVPYAAVYRPTKKQLYYYLKSTLSDEEKYIARYGEKQAHNNIRALHSDTIADLDIKSIGARYEIDETETDFYLVSRYDRRQVIGRAILYFAVDVFSKAITGFSFGIDNNSWAGLEMCLLNMGEDKVELCRKAGINIDVKDWPINNVLPSSIQTDNGSEYLSNNFEKFGREMGIKISFAPTRMGSYKPNVEQKFRQFNIHTKTRVPGEIIKDEYGKSHISGARLTVEEFYQIVLEFILSYNKTPMEDYPLDQEMLEAGIVPTPLNIWKWKSGQENGLRKIHDFNQFKYSLLSEGNAVIIREGIRFKNILYTCENLDWLNRQMVDAEINGRKSLKIRYDVRNMNIIYFEVNGSIIKGWINERKAQNSIYQNVSYFELKAIRKLLKEKKIIISEQRLAEHMNLHNRIDTIVKEAKKKHPGKNTSKNIREYRKAEKELLHSEAQVTIETNKTSESIQVISQQPNLGKAPTLIEIEKMDLKSLSFAEKLKLQEKIDYEVKVLGHSKE